MSLLHRAEARWEQIEDEVPAVALRLHRRLLTRQIQLVEEDALLPADAPVLDPPGIVRRLVSGTPVLLAIQDFATGDLDRAAISHGFRRAGLQRER